MRACSSSSAFSASGDPRNSIWLSAAHQADHSTPQCSRGQRKARALERGHERTLEMAPVCCCCGGNDWTLPLALLPMLRRGPIAASAGDGGGSTDGGTTRGGSAGAGPDSCRMCSTTVATEACASDLSASHCQRLCVPRNRMVPWLSLVPTHAGRRAWHTPRRCRNHRSA